MYLTKRLRRRPRGVTLVESLIAIAMLSATLAAMFAIYRYQMFGLIAQSTQLDTQQSGRAFLDLFVREVRQAGADPTGSGLSGIVSASTSSLQIQFDRNANGAIDDGEQVTYQLANGSVTRTANGGLATVFATGVPAAASNAFTYYDNGGNPIAPGGGNSLSAAQLATVRRVQLRLTLQQPHPDPNDPLPLASTFSTSVDLRNRWMR